MNVKAEDKNVSLENTLRKCLDDLERRKEELAEREKKLAAEWEKRGTARLAEIERRGDLLMERFEARAGEIIEDIQRQAERKKADSQSRRKVARAKREFQEELETAVAGRPESAARPAKIAEGVTVRLRGVRQPARVARMLRDDLIEVEAGYLKLQVAIDDVLEVLPASERAPRLPENVTFEAGPRWDVSCREINVIGHRAEQACEEVDKFLDTAVVASVNRVRIVHGHGMGILRRAIAELLESSPHVEKFYPAPQSEGGTGATIAELKE